MLFSVEQQTKRIVRVAIALAFLSLYNPFATLAAPDEEILGKNQRYPVGPPLADERFRVGSFSNMDKIFPFNTVRKGAQVLPLKRVSPEPRLSYKYNGRIISIEEYLKQRRVTGLLVIKNGNILFERYQYDRKDTDRLVSNSIAKSINSLAVGLAVRDGSIASLDDMAGRYVPELSNTAYGQTSIRDLLRMSSGVRFSEEYSGNDDHSRFIQTLMEKGAVSALRLFQVRDTAAGAKFHYASSESLALGLVVHRSTGKTLSGYISENLWKPLGAEDDATWVLDPTGMEWTFAKFSAVLRDYGRLGNLLANDGILNNKRILPAEYLLEATDWHRQPKNFWPGAATPYLGYGYQFWLFPGEKRRFALIGNFGQILYVDPAEKLVIVQTAVEQDPSDVKLLQEFEALATGVLKSMEERRE